MVEPYIFGQHSASQFPCPRFFWLKISPGLGSLLRVLQYRFWFYPSACFNSTIEIRRTAVATSMSEGKNYIHLEIVSPFWLNYDLIDFYVLWHECLENDWFFGISAFLLECQDQYWNQSSIRPSRQHRYWFELSILVRLRLR